MHSIPMRTTPPVAPTYVDRFALPEAGLLQNLTLEQRALCTNSIFPAINGAFSSRPDVPLADKGTLHEFDHAVQALASSIPHLIKTAGFKNPADFLAPFERGRELIVSNDMRWASSTAEGYNDIYRTRDNCTADLFSQISKSYAARIASKTEPDGTTSEKGKKINRGQTAIEMRLIMSGKSSDEEIGQFLYAVSSQPGTFDYLVANPLATIPYVLGYFSRTKNHENMRKASKLTLAFLTYFGAIKKQTELYQERQSR